MSITTRFPLLSLLSLILLSACSSLASDIGSSKGRQEEEENPYLFRLERFQSRITSQEGSINVLERFDERSNLLEGLHNYRVTFVELNPNTFQIPNHWDADTISIALSGRGAVTLIQRDNNKETHNIERGDVIRIRAGTMVHFINRDNKEKLYFAELVRPVNTPGSFESFFGPGGRDPESYFSAFSNEILEAAFKTPPEQLRKLFEGQNRGVFVRASREQIQALSEQSSSEHGPWPLHHGGERSQSSRPFNLFNQRPSQSNKYGKLYMANPDDFRQLQDLDVAVSFVNITQGCMIGPYYNSRSTKIVMVISGNGHFEIACPHLSQQQKQGGQHGSGSSISYQKVSARVSRGDVFVVPPGHPIVTVASNGQNLQAVCFDVNARNNQRFPLAGNNNILKQLEREAKELSFGVPARQVDEIFNRQHESWFFPGPQGRQEHGGGHVSM